jgi:hypothetical protein
MTHKKDSEPKMKDALELHREMYERRLRLASLYPRQGSEKDRRSSPLERTKQEPKEKLKVPA